MADPGGQGKNRVDQETLAAYLDGRLPEPERARVEEHLAASAEELEVLAEAVRLQEDVAAARRPWVRRLPSTLLWGAPLAAAAVMTAVFLLPRKAADPAEVAALLEARAAALVNAGWSDHGWTVLRAGPTPLPAERAAFRAGVLWMDALVGVRLESGTAAARHFRALETLLDGVPFGSAAAASLAEAASGLEAGDGGPGPGQIQNAAAALRAALSPTYLALGSWVEGVRLAALAGDGVALQEARAGLGSLDSQAFPEGVQGLLDEVDTLLGDTPTQAGYADLARTAGILITMLGG